MQPPNGFFGRMKAKMDRVNLRGSRGSRGSVNNLPTGALVSVNVYDMLWLNVYINHLGIGVYHTGVVVHGIEYCYGGHPLSYSGIFAMAPQDVEFLGPNYSYKTTIELGHTDFTEADVALILEDMGPEYQGDQYHLLRRNCNHFSDAFVQILCGASLPKWINRLATVGAKLPFVERTIPRFWLTPHSIEELTSAANSVNDGFPAARGSRRRQLMSAVSTQTRSQPLNSSTTLRMTDRNSITSDSPELLLIDDQLTSEEPPSRNPDVTSCTNVQLCPNSPTNSGSSGANSSDNHFTTPKEPLLKRIGFRVPKLAAVQQHPSSTHMPTSPGDSRRPSTTSSISGDGTIRLSYEVTGNSFNKQTTRLRSNSAQSSHTKIPLGEIIHKRQPECNQIPIIDNPIVKTDSTRSNKHSIKTPSNLNCAGSFRNGLLSRLQNLCGASHTDDCADKNHLHESEERPTWSVISPDA